MEMQKTYNPKDFEARLYEEWEKNNYFRAQNCTIDVQQCKNGSIWSSKGYGFRLYRYLSLVYALYLVYWST